MVLSVFKILKADLCSDWVQTEEGTPTFSTNSPAAEGGNSRVNAIDPALINQPWACGFLFEGVSPEKIPLNSTHLSASMSNEVGRRMSWCSTRRWRARGDSTRRMRPQGPAQITEPAELSPARYSTPRNPRYQQMEAQSRGQGRGLWVSVYVFGKRGQENRV